LFTGWHVMVKTDFHYPQADFIAFPSLFTKILSPVSGTMAVK
jgi:hypothetical protein